MFKTQLPFANPHSPQSLRHQKSPSGFDAQGAQPRPSFQQDRAVWTRFGLCTEQGYESAFAESGGLVHGDELADMLREGPRDADTAAVSQPISQVARWISSGTAVAFGGGSGWLLPLFQFELPQLKLRPEMAPLLAELRGVFAGLELAQWFVTPNDWLAGQCPACTMRVDLPAVLQAARAERYVVCGG